MFGAVAASWQGSSRQTPTPTTWVLIGSWDLCWVWFVMQHNMLVARSSACVAPMQAGMYLLPCWATQAPSLPHWPIRPCCANKRCVCPGNQSNHRWSAVSRSERYRKRLQENGEDTSGLGAWRCSGLGWRCWSEHAVTAALRQHHHVLPVLCSIPLTLHPLCIFLVSCRPGQSAAQLH